MAAAGPARSLGKLSAGSEVPAAEPARADSHIRDRTTITDGVPLKLATLTLGVNHDVASSLVSSSGRLECAT